MAPLFSTLNPPRPATVHPPVPKHSAMVWHLKPEKIGNKPGLQFLLVTFEGWADKGLTGPLYDRDEPVHKHFIDEMKPMLHVLDLGTRENPFTNSAGYPKKALAFRVTPGDEPHQFGNIQDPDGVASMAEVEAWMSEKLIPHMMPIANWHRNSKPNMNNDDWYHVICTADEILKGGMINMLICISFINEPYKWVDSMEAFYKMHHVCIYSFYPKGSLTKDFMKRHKLAIEHIDPEDYANHPTGSLATAAPSKSIFEIDPEKRHGVRKAEQDSKPATVNTDTKVPTEEKKLPEQDTKTDEQDSKPAAVNTDTKVPLEEKKVAAEDTKTAEQDSKPAKEPPKAPEGAMLAQLLAQVAALTAQLSNLPNNQNATAQLAAITTQLPTLLEDNSGTKETVTEENKSAIVTEEKKSETGKHLSRKKRSPKQRKCLSRNKKV